MADDDPVVPAPTASTPWFTQQAGSPGLSTTPDDSNTNLQLNKIASDMGSQSDALVTALGTITTALNAKPSA